MRRLIGPAVVFVGGGFLLVAITIVSIMSVVFVSGAAACSTTALGGTLPQATVEYLDGRNIEERAKENQERYLYAQKQTGVPWQVMAALHYREAGMNPNSSISNGAPLGSGVNVDGVHVVSDANQDATNMANHFKRLALGVYNIDVVSHLDEMTVDDWGQAFLAYNRGYLYRNQGVSYTQSPYVMNGLDENHMNMQWTNADTVSGVDGNKAGALAVLEYLEGVTALGSPLPSGCVGTVVAPVKGDTLVLTSGASIRTRSNGVTRMHQGIDIVASGDKTIMAAMAGTVVVAQNDHFGYGTTVKIDHGNGSATLYAHMVTDSLLVTKGDQVIAGQALGTMGNTGDSEGVHLHFQVWVDNVLINPYAFLAERGIKLTWVPWASPVNTLPGPLVDQ